MSDQLQAVLADHAGNEAWRNVVASVAWFLLDSAKAVRISEDEPPDPKSRLYFELSSVLLHPEGDHLELGRAALECGAEFVRFVQAHIVEMIDMFWVDGPLPSPVKRYQLVDHIVTMLGYETAHAWTAVTLSEHDFRPDDDGMTTPTPQE